MSKIVAALRRTLTPTYTEPDVHLHQGMIATLPEVCYDGNCRRPRLARP